MARKRQEPEDKRQVSVFEAMPFITDYGKRFFLATEEERIGVKRQYPGYIVRLATGAELDALNGQTWEEMERELIAKAIELQR